MPDRPFSIYVDEDAMDGNFVLALRSRSVTVVTVRGAGREQLTDEEQLAYAAGMGCVVYSFNVRDFYRLHTLWTSAGREHSGMILAPQQRYSIGEQVRRILPIREGMTDVAMRSHVEFLANWV